MNQSELDQARTNPDFLKFLQEQEQRAIKERSIGELYQVLDTLLVLNLDEERIHKVYQEILKISFDQIELKLETGSKLTLVEDDIFLIRSFYEHAIEKWSRDDYKGAKELFFILSQIVDDKKLEDSFAIHMLSCANKTDMDHFYQKSVATNQEDDEKYGYFITNYQFSPQEYLEQNLIALQEQHKQMEHLLHI